MVSKNLQIIGELARLPQQKYDLLKSPLILALRVRYSKIAR